MRRALIALIALLVGAGIFVVAKADTVDLFPPLPGKLRISGSFGEYRSGGRYHHGLDLKTFEFNGVPVRAPLDGYVASIHTSEYGYGNGIFFRSGQYQFTFGHLNDFMGDNPGLEDFRRAIRILQPDHIVAVTIPPWFQFQKGSLIAHTGESGLGAPHLHFEVNENGIFKNPLLFSGIKAKDNTDPEFISVIIETADRTYLIPAEKKGSSYELPVALPRVPLRILAGVIDTQAALNRNGIEKISLEINDRVIFERTIDQIKPEALRSADRLFHPHYTVIGKVYFYYLFEQGAGYQALEKDGALIRASDAAENSSRLVIKSATDTSVAALERYAINTPAFQPVSINGGYYYGRSGNASLQIALGRLPMAGKISAIPGPPASAIDLLLKPGLTRAGDSFSISTRDLLLGDGCRLTYRMPFRADLPALYSIHPVTGMISLLAMPQALGGQIVYDTFYRTEGVIVPLTDSIPPRIERVLIYGSLPGVEPLDPDYDSSGEWSRDYYISDIGTGIRPDTIKVLLDGQSVPYVWKGDRAVATVTLPNELLSPSGNILSLHVIDGAGNPAQWLIDPIEKRKEQKP